MPEVTPAMEGQTIAPSNVISIDVFNVTDRNSTVVPSTGIIFCLSYICLLIAFCGLLGNSIVIWLLGFRIPKNKFTVYFLNLAIADVLFLFSVWVQLVVIICMKSGHWISDVDTRNISIFMGLLYNVGFNTGIYLLMTVSIERCLCALYPIWYQYRHPKHQSDIVCILLWALSGLVTGLENFIPGSEPRTAVYLFTSALFLLVIILMILSSLILFITVQKISDKCQPLRLYIVIIVSVVVFLISVVPARLLGLLLYFKVLSSYFLLVYFYFITVLCSSVNCAANPFIYFLVGSLRRWRFSGSFFIALQRIFKDETETKDNSKRLPKSNVFE
ncbi:proto-oncogene Mas [Microcaecilia unicolor]|uniref:Proto-oncogene Mas-like n=1 Tax=Microcaecilia unicolor TaxID=1415580 RepID=A0A6P7WYG4_9AMPH|nr:proto-oncogene Mas-like [Microcaecilia unicolor]